VKTSENPMKVSDKKTEITDFIVSVHDRGLWFSLVDKASGDRPASGRFAMRSCREARNFATTKVQ
jgi:hypothetical protein